MFIAVIGEKEFSDLRRGESSLRRRYQTTTVFYRREGDTPPEIDFETFKDTFDLAFQNGRVCQVCGSNECNLMNVKDAMLA